MSPLYFVFPNINGKNTANLEKMGAILNVSQNKLNAYRLLKILLSEEIQSKSAMDVNIVGFSVLNSAMAARAETGFKQANGNVIEESYSALYNIPFGKIFISENIIQEFVEMMSDIDNCQIHIPQVNKFIYDNMEPYFNNTGSYENCLNKLRNDLELYMSE